MPSNGKPYRVHRGRRIKRPRRPIRSADDVRLTAASVAAGEGLEPVTDDPVTDERDHGVPLAGDQVERDEVVVASELYHDDPYDPASPREGLGYAIVEPPPAEPPRRPGALPPSPQTSPGRPPSRGRSDRQADPEGRRRLPGLRLMWSLSKWLVGLALLLAFVCVAWGILGFFVIRGGVNEANTRVDSATLSALSEPPGSALTTPRTILFLGVDTGGARDGTGRADSIVLMRTDPDQHRISLLAIPRDLRVGVQGRGLDKINAAFAAGGVAATIDAIDDLTGIPIHHVALIDFDSFPEVIDAVGGVTLDVPARIVSNRFDCPYPSQVACVRWEGWRFSAGEQTMDGERALIYSRVRENRLDESESDIERGARQQSVIRATADQLVSLRTFTRLPLVGRDVTRPLTTDLTTSELFELAWVKFRTPEQSVVQCRLGGSPTRIDGVSYLVGPAQNSVVVNMFLGRAVPRKPQASAGSFAAGCPVTGEN